MRTFSRVAITLMALCLSALAWSAEAFKAGEDYKVLEQPGPVDDPSTVEVREFFWYGCPHCFQLEATLDEWRKSMPQGAKFIRTPPALNDAWEPHARAYYVAEALGKADEITTALFDAMHVKKENIRTEDDLASFFAKHGVTEEEFHNLYNSFAIRTKVRVAKTIATGYKLRGVPSIVVNGKYFVDGALAKSNPRMMEIVNFLINKEKISAKGG